MPSDIDLSKLSISELNQLKSDAISEIWKRQDDSYATIPIATRKVLQELITEFLDEYETPVTVREKISIPIVFTFGLFGATIIPSGEVDALDEELLVESGKDRKSITNKKDRLQKLFDEIEKMSLELASKYNISQKWLLSVCDIQKRFFE